MLIARCDGDPACSDRELFRDHWWMSDAIEFDPDLYRGTAEYYDRFRVLYPAEMVADLVDRVQPSGGGRFLDLACGTGQIAFAIAEHFGEVWAADQEPEMIEAVQHKAEVGGTDRVRTVVSSAEQLDAPADAFELVAIGNAFHRLRRDVVAANAFRWVQREGCIALLWSTGPASGERDWQLVLSDVLARWTSNVGARSRVPAGWDQARLKRSDATVLTAAGFQPVHAARFLVEHELTIDAVLGYVYSTAALPRAALGFHLEAFERDLRHELDSYARSGPLLATIDSAYELARSPD